MSFKHNYCTKEFGLCGMLWQGALSMGKHADSADQGLQIPGPADSLGGPGHG